MIEHKEYLKEGPSYDIVVLGGGFAGCAAALSASRLGKKVCVVEKASMLGGLATLGQVNWFVAMDNGRGKQIIKGMCEEFALLSMKYGFGDRNPAFVNGRIPKETIAQYEAEGKKIPHLTNAFSIGIFSLQLAEILTKTGVKIMYDTIFSDVIKNAGNEGKIDGVIIENKSGRQVIFAQQFIDATGDADLVYRAGLPTEKRGGFHFYSAISTDLSHAEKAVETRNIRDLYFDTKGGGVNLHGKGSDEDLAKGLYDGTDGEDVSRYLLANQQQMLDKWRVRVEESTEKEKRKAQDIIVLSGMNQVRTSRRLEGDYTMTTEKDEYTHHADSICAINDFARKDFLYEIPFRALVKTGFPNTIAAGRIISAHGWMWDATRVIPPAILTGQAAGVAAA